MPFPSGQVNNAAVCSDAQVQISAKSDYALRALCVLAQAWQEDGTGCSVKAADIAGPQQVPRTFLDQILLDLRRAGLVESRRGPEGGHRPEELAYAGPAARLQDVWVAVRAGLRQVLEHTTLEQVVGDALPSAVTSLSSDVRSWTSVWPPRAPD